MGRLVHFAVVNFWINMAAVLMAPLNLPFSGPATLGTIQAIGGVGMLSGSVVMGA